jgi:site-specific recombinase
MTRQTLEYVLSELAQASPSDDPAWLVDLVASIRPARAERVADAVARVERIADRVERTPEFAALLASRLFRLFENRRQRHMLSEIGVFSEEGFYTGLWRRVSHRLLPPAPDLSLWADVFGEVFSNSEDAAWVDAVPARTWQKLFAGVRDAALRIDDQCAAGAAQLLAESLESLRMLAYRLAALGLEPRLVRYYSPPPQHASPFVAVADELLDWCSRAASAPAPAGFDPEHLAHVEVLLGQCDAVLARVRRLAHEQGTSIRLTTLIICSGSIVRRIRALLAALADADASARARAASELFVSLVKGQCSANGVRELFVHGTDLLALQISENASRTGEHYVTTTRAEYWAMARSAAGAGVVVGFMALVKILIAKLYLPPFWEAFFFGLNYAAGFVLVHLLHFTIATKQPAMTAARITSAADAAPDRRSALVRVAELTAQITRTQTVAILGNVALAFPVALAIALAWQHGVGAPVTDAAKSAQLLHDSHPWRSLALAHAAIAGVCLFLSGVISGYYDHRCVYSQVPQRIRGARRLRRMLGAPRVDTIAAYVENNLGAIAGNIAFGFMLGFVGFFGFVLGLPLDIRHVTFSGANTAYGLVGIGWDIRPGELLVTVAGVGLVGMVNLGVSFWLALYTGMKARGVRVGEIREFTDILRARFRAEPRTFLLPPRET